MLGVIGSVFVFLPLIFGTYHFRLLKKDIARIYLYLLICLGFEVFGIVTTFILKKSFIYTHLVFSITELILIIYITKDWLKKSISNLYQVSIILFDVIWLVDIYFYGISHMNYFYGVAIFILISLCFIFIFHNGIEIKSDWRVSFILGILVYNILRSVIFSFIDFFYTNQHYLIYYLVIHTIANILSYLFMFYSFYICKKQLSRAL